MTLRQVDTHQVARVYYAEPQWGHSERRWVRCARLEASVPLEQCARCPHLHDIATDAQGEPAAVHCGHLRPMPGEAVVGTMELPRVPISDLMTRNVLCVRPALSLDALMELFVQTGLKAVPVVESSGALLGIATEEDALLDMHARSETSHRDAQSVMSGRPLTIPENMPVSRAAAVMVSEDVSRLVVVDTEGEIVGVLSSADVLYWLAHADGYLLTPSGRESL